MFRWLTDPDSRYRYTFFLCLFFYTTCGFCIYRVRGFDSSWHRRFAYFGIHWWGVSEVLRGCNFKAGSKVRQCCLSESQFRLTGRLFKIQEVKEKMVFDQGLRLWCVRILGGFGLELTFSVGWFVRLLKADMSFMSFFSDRDGSISLTNVHRTTITRFLITSAVKEKIHSIFDQI